MAYYQLQEKRISPYKNDIEFFSVMTGRSRELPINADDILQETTARVKFDVAGQDYCEEMPITVCTNVYGVVSYWLAEKTFTERCL